MTRTNCLKLALLPFFAVLAVGSSSPKKTFDDGTKPADTASGSTTTTSAGGAAKILGHCTAKTGGSCSEKYTFRIGGEPSEKTGCETINGTYESGTACPSKDNLIGICAISGFQISPSEPAPLREKLYYYDEGANKGVTGAKGKDGCTALTGTWTDGPAASKPAAAAKPAAATKAAAAPKKK